MKWCTLALFLIIGCEAGHTDTYNIKCYSGGNVVLDLELRCVFADGACYDTGGNLHVFKNLPCYRQSLRAPADD